jgi:uncharacterized membrane protein
MKFSGRITSTVALMALTVWVGGLVVLGAVVAPIVFGAVPYATAADAMTLVFKRYDKIAMGAAVVVLATEAVRARLSGRFGAADTARALVTLVLAAMAAAEGLWITPKIAELHAEGVMRGVGEAGASLDSAHALAEQLGKGQAVLALVLIALHLFTVGRTHVAVESDED